MTINYNILDNLPIKELSIDTDCFDTLKKADAIKEFLSNCFIDKENNSNIKMISLYGNWGTGKSSIIKYLEKNLSEEKFKTIFFEAWQHEKDDDLAFSLSDCIASNKSKTMNELGKNFVSSSYTLFKSFLSSVSFSIHMAPVSVPGVPNLSIKPIDAIKYVEENIKENYESMSFFSRLEKFKKDFKSLEDNILGENNNKRLIVFIDDLDRCESENVMEILSVIKNFFVFGERTVFFCALDKNAIKNAIQTKYKDVIKSEEYLEKIFDVSFNMPSIFSIKKLLKNYFQKTDKYISKFKFIKEKKFKYKSLILLSIGVKHCRYNNIRYL